MTVEFLGAYQPTVKQVVDITEKVCERAIGDLESLGIATNIVEVVAEQNVAIRRAIQMQVDRETFDLEGRLLPTLRVGCALYLAKLDKVRESQLKLGIEEPDDTDAAIAMARSLITAASGQAVLALDSAKPRTSTDAAATTL